MSMWVFGTQHKITSITGFFLDVMKILRNGDYTLRKLYTKLRIIKKDIMITVISILLRVSGI